jgi:hypothetical protein
MKGHKSFVVCMSTPEAIQYNKTTVEPEQRKSEREKRNEKRRG